MFTLAYEAKKGGKVPNQDNKGPPSSKIVLEGRGVAKLREMGGRTGLSVSKFLSSGSCVMQRAIALAVVSGSPGSIVSVLSPDDETDMESLNSIKVGQEVTISFTDEDGKETSLCCMIGYLLPVKGKPEAPPKPK